MDAQLSGSGSEASNQIEFSDIESARLPSLAIEEVLAQSILNPAQIAEFTAQVAELKKQLPSQYLSGMLAGLVPTGISINCSLNLIADEVDDPALKKVFQAIADTVKSGESLTDSLRNYPEYFDQIFVAIIQTEEYSGILAADERTTAFLARLPEIKEEAPSQYFLATLGRLLSSGTPILRALKAIKAEAKSPELREALSTITKQTYEGESISDTMKPYTDLFDPSVINVVREGEFRGALDQLCIEHYEAVRNGNVASVSA